MSDPRPEVAVSASATLEADLCIALGGIDPDGYDHDEYLAAVRVPHEWTPEDVVDALRAALVSPDARRERFDCDVSPECQADATVTITTPDGDVHLCGPHAARHLAPDAPSAAEAGDGIMGWPYDAGTYCAACEHHGTNEHDLGCPARPPSAAEVLDDLRERLAEKQTLLEQMSADNHLPLEKRRIFAKANGVALALSFVDEARRALPEAPR